MAIQNITTLKSYFETGDIPTANQYIDLLDTLFSLSSSDVYTKAEIDAKDDLRILITGIQDNLTSTATNVPLSANQGKVLKDLIDNINTLLTSDDTTLDELQEVVDFIKLNKTTLDTLSISNIVGLQTALDNKSDKLYDYVVDTLAEKDALTGLTDDDTIFVKDTGEVFTSTATGNGVDAESSSLGLGTKTIDETDIADGKILQYDSASGTYILVDLPTSGAEYRYWLR